MHKIMWNCAGSGRPETVTLELDGDILDAIEGHSNQEACSAAWSQLKNNSETF